MKECLLDKTKFSIRHKDSPNIGAVTYGGHKQIARIAHYLYDDATVYLERKYNKVKHLL